MENKCKTCYGCNRLEDKNFVGVVDCKNYVRATPTVEDNINKIKKILEIGEQMKLWIKLKYLLDYQV